MTEPRAWCRMAPFAEKDEISVSARTARTSAEGPPEEGACPAGRTRVASRRDQCGRYPASASGRESGLARCRSTGPRSGRISLRVCAGTRTGVGSARGDTGEGSAASQARRGLLGPADPHR